MALMGLLVAAAALAVSRVSIGSERAGEPGDPYEASVERLSAATESPAVLGAVFLAVALLAGVVTIAAVGGFGLPTEAAAGLFGATVAVLGLLVAAFLFLGPYVLVRQRGLGNAHGVGAGLAGLGFAFLALIVVELVIGVV